MIDTRVCIDDTLGPFDCKLDPTNRWNGWLSPHFPLSSARELSAQTLRMADEYGYDSVDTIHVIEGRTDSTETVHVIEGGQSSYSDEDGIKKELAVAVRINWRSLDRDAENATRITDANPKARKAARKSKVTGRGATRSVVVHVRWTYLDEGNDAATVVRPDRLGLYPIGGWEWTWHFASWLCLCGSDQDWHETDCLCGLTRDSQPATPIAAATWKAGAALRRLAPEATSARLDIRDGKNVIFAVYAGDTEIDTADDTGPFDTETLGEADAILGAALDQAAPGELTEAGWEHIWDGAAARVWQITFPAAPARDAEI